ncbi:TolC family protein [Pedobacter sp. MC2016-24]|uniref:TolC family protein n=1 Tax=Pedobacter sp. MC2016-24 TaxID=2780090 RepID=UPI00187E54FE|nr:TolC family protein [Pedobacter sp. MC2016-24]MBE9600088.1 TolC family protein [Pedobacter sp. MC2016-24]
MNFSRYQRELWMCMSFLLTSIISHAQDITASNTLNINQVWALTDSNSRKLQMQHLNVEASEAEVKVARAERLPEIGANGVLAHIFPMPIYENGLFHTPAQYPVEPKYYKVAADAYLNLYNGGKTNREIAASKTERDLSIAQKNLSQQDLHYMAAVYFYDVYRNLSYQTLLREDIKDREKQLNEINQLYKNGTVLKSDVLRAELRLSKQKMLLTEIENSIRIASQKLNLLTGRPDDLVLNPVIEDPELKTDLLKGLDDYLQEGIGHSFKIQVSTQEQKLSALELRQVKANVLPSIGLFAEYMYAYPQIQFYPYALSLYSNGMAGLKLKIPISSWYTNKNKVRAAEIRLQRQEVEDEAVKDDVRQEIQEAYIRYHECLKRIDVAEENILQASESYRIVQNTYFNQLALLTDLLDAETQVLQSKFELTTAKVNARIQYYQLQKAAGKL